MYADQSVGHHILVPCNGRLPRARLNTSIVRAMMGCLPPSERLQPNEVPFQGSVPSPEDVSYASSVHFASSVNPILRSVHGKVP